MIVAVVRRRRRRFIDADAKLVTTHAELVTILGGCLRALEKCLCGGD